MNGKGFVRWRTLGVGLVVGAVGLGAAFAARTAGTPQFAAWAAEPRCPPAAAADAAVGHQVGQRAPDFSLADFLGSPVRLSSFRGCPVLLDFWASWCKPCQTSIPKLETLRQKHAGRGLVVIAVSLDYRREDAARFMETNGIREFVNLWAPFTEAHAVARLFGVEAIPRTVLLDRQGIVRFNGHPQHLTDAILTPWL